MSHSERIQEAAKEIHDALTEGKLSYIGRADKIAAIISKHIPEQNELREIALLIGSIFFHGNFKAETFNERELEKLLRKNGYFFETEDELLRSLATPSEPLWVTKENK